MSAREAALERRIEELTDAIIELLDGARAIVEISGRDAPREKSNADGFRRAIEWAAGHLHDAAQDALTLTDFVASPLDGEQAAREAEAVP